MTLQRTQPSHSPIHALMLRALLCLLSLLVLSIGAPALAQESGAAGEEGTSLLAGAGEQAAGEDTEKAQSNTVVSVLIKVIVAIAILFVAFIALIMSPILPVFQSKLEPEVIVEHIGKNSNAAGKKVLVAYFTRHGTAASIAEKIYDIMRQRGFAVDMRFIGNIGSEEDLSQYDAFVIGSAVYWAMAQDFIDFVADHKAVLAQKPVAVFSCCLTIQRETPKNLERVAAYIESGLKHVPELQPIDKVAFAGKVEMPKLTFPEKAFLWFLFTVTPQRGGDHRDWTKITAWAEKIASQI